MSRIETLISIDFEKGDWLQQVALPHKTSIRHFRLNQPTKKNTKTQRPKLKPPMKSKILFSWLAGKSSFLIGDTSSFMVGFPASHVSFPGCILGVVTPSPVPRHKFTTRYFTAAFAGVAAAAAPVGRVPLAWSPTFDSKRFCWKTRERWLIPKHNLACFRLVKKPSLVAYRGYLQKMAPPTSNVKHQLKIDWVGRLSTSLRRGFAPRYPPVWPRYPPVWPRYPPVVSHGLMENPEWE